MNAGYTENEYYLFNPKKKRAYRRKAREAYRYLPEIIYVKKIPSLWRSFGMVGDLENTQFYILKKDAINCILKYRNCMEYFFV